jgi:hypothetical protein
VLKFDRVADRPLPRFELSRDAYLETSGGWSLAFRAAGAKLLVQRRGPITRALGFFETQEAWASVARWVVPALNRASDVTVVLFDNAEPIGCGLAPGPAPFWLGHGTLLFDLGLSDELLLSQVASRERSKVRKLRSEGWRTRFTTTAGDELEAFHRFFTALAMRRRLRVPSMRSMQDMLEAGRAFLAASVSPTGSLATVNVVFVSDTHGYYLHGAHDGSLKEAGGHLLHLETLSECRRRGRSWYDFGLIGSLDPDDGIVRFKRSLGGIFQHSGREWRYRSPAFSTAQRLLARQRSWTRR